MYTNIKYNIYKEKQGITSLLFFRINIFFNDYNKFKAILGVWLAVASNVADAC